jgi:hypothetical protein
LEILISQQENDIGLNEYVCIREINSMRKWYFVNCITTDKNWDGITLLEMELCGSEPWTRKQRDVREIEAIQVRLLRPNLESKIYRRA